MDKQQVVAALSRKDQTSRRPFYLFLVEFQDFCANEGAAKTLAQILSECRRFGLHLHLAHQTLGQIQERISSALCNIGIKVVFSVDWEDAEVMARKTFMVDTEEIRHDAQAKARHPLFSSLTEQWDKAVATIQNLPPRVALVKRHGARVAQIRTENIPPYRVTANEGDKRAQERNTSCNDKSHAHRAYHCGGRVCDLALGDHGAKYGAGQSHDHSHVACGCGYPRGYSALF